MSTHTETNQLPYSIELTRLHNKQFAPKGGVYIVIRHTDIKNRMKYQSALLVKSDVVYSDEKAKQELAKAMWSKLKIKYAL